jgi:hypothetical protein
MPRKPKTANQRIITETVDSLLALAEDADAARIPPDQIARELRAMAEKLDSYDARTASLDPSKRRRKSATTN